jgi:hypothetical protein
VASLGAVTLPDGLVWVDEYAWSPISSEVAITLGGSVVIQQAAQLKGRPITLAGTDRHGWATRSTVAALQALADVAGATYTLTLPGPRTYTVAWRHEGGAALEAVQVDPVEDPASTDWYSNLQLRLMEV